MASVIAETRLQATDDFRFDSTRQRSLPVSADDEAPQATADRPPNVSTAAELAITGTVQKVSNLILNINIYVRDASSGATIAAMSADMRGNTDKSWSRTLDWLVRNRLLAPGYGSSVK